MLRVGMRASAYGNRNERFCSSPQCNVIDFQSKKLLLLQFKLYSVLWCLKLVCPLSYANT